MNGITGDHINKGELNEEDKAKLRVALSILSGRLDRIFGRDLYMLGFDDTRQPPHDLLLERCEEIVFKALEK